MLDRADNRLYSSGWRLRGWVSGSSLLRRDEEEGELPSFFAKEREVRTLGLSWRPGDAGRDDFLGDEDLVGDGAEGDLTGEEGSECELWFSSPASPVVACFLDGFLEVKRPFIWERCKDEVLLF